MLSSPSPELTAQVGAENTKQMLGVKTSSDASSAVTPKLNTTAKSDGSSKGASISFDKAIVSDVKSIDTSTSSAVHTTTNEKVSTSKVDTKATLQAQNVTADTIIVYQEETTPVIEIIGLAILLGLAVSWVFIRISRKSSK